MLAIDSTTWKFIKPTTARINDVCFYDGEFIIVGKDGVMLSSKDVVDWTVVDTGVTSNLNSIACCSGINATIVGDAGVVLTFASKAYLVYVKFSYNYFEVRAMDDSMIVCVDDGTTWVNINGEVKTV